MSQTKQPATISHVICEPDASGLAIPPHPAAQRLASSLLANASRISQIHHWADLRITAAGRHIFARRITPETSDAVLEDAQAVLQGHDDAVIELDTYGTIEELERIKAGSFDAFLFIRAGIGPLPELRTFCRSNPCIIRDAAHWHAGLGRLLELAIARAELALGEEVR